jgi:hypothetical protein
MNNNVRKFNKIQNFSGQIVYKTIDKKWYHFSASVWLLFGGLILLTCGCFTKPDWVGGIFRLLDVRLWKWWYFIFLALLIAFSVKWFFICRNWEEYDEMELDAAKRFNRMSITIIILMAIIVSLSSSRWLFSGFYYPLERWLGYGAFSWIALLNFVLIIAAIVPVIYFVWEWIVTLGKE